MKTLCPNHECRSGEIKRVISHNDGSDNIDNLAHYRLECLQCGRQFNLWDCPIDQVKKAFGDNWELYS